MYIYRFTNLKNRKVYIGKTLQLLGTRERKHITNALRGNNTLPLFYRALRKYGPESFLIEVLGYAQSEKELSALEIHHIREHKSHQEAFGYNLTLGGEGGQKTDTTRARMSAAHRGKKLSDSHRATLSQVRRGVPGKRGIANGNFGKKHSLEWSLAISEGQRGKVLTEVHKDKIRRAHTGKKLSPEHCRNVSKALTGKKQSPEHVAKVIASRTGRRRAPLTESHKLKISQAGCGRVTSSETKKLISQAWTPERRAAQSARTIEANRRRYAKK